MKIFYHKNFLRALNNFPDSIKKKLKKQIIYLVKDIRHPSLHAKKYDESLDLWQARVDKGVRFYFVIENDVYVLVDIKYHSK
jgi:mRNA-degrading endonuclease RelE of RelBE toxin-antitoxin system